MDWNWVVLWCCCSYKCRDCDVRKYTIATILWCYCATVITAIKHYNLYTFPIMLNCSTFSRRWRNLSLCWAPHCHFWHMEFNWCIVQFYLYNLSVSSNCDMCCKCSYAEMQESHKFITKIVWFKHRWTYGKLEIWKGCSWPVLTISYNLYETFHTPFLVILLMDQ